MSAAEIIDIAPPVGDTDAAFTITLFPDELAKTKTERTITLAELAELIRGTSAVTKDRLPYLKLATFGDKHSDKNCLRHNANLLEVHGVECDYDDGGMTFTEAVELARAAGVRGIMYTSASHRPEKPRWRALFPLAIPTAPDGRNEMMNRANGILGGAIAPESWNLSQGFMYGRVEGCAEFLIEVIDGAPIDALPDLPTAPKPKPKARVADRIDRLPKKWRALIRTGDAAEYDDDRSAAIAAVAKVLVERGWADADIAAVLLDRANGISAHAYDQNDPQRAAANAIALARRVEPEIAELNQTHAVILVGDRVAVLREFVDADGRPGFGLMTQAAFNQWYAPRRVQIGEKLVPLADHWFRHPQRRQFDGLIFTPGRDVPGYYNLWRGFAVEPRPGDCSKFLGHLHDNVCRGDDDQYRFTVGWFADIFQNPGRKAGTSLAIRGKQGTGKTKVGEVFGSLLGPHYLLISDQRYLTGRFNGHLVSLLLLHADEAFWAGDHAAEGRLKDLITGYRHLIELKGKEPIPVDNYIRTLITGNPEWIVPAGMEERRFAVLEMGEKRMRDYDYFKAIDAEMNNGGREALLHHLMTFDLSTVNLREIPKTEALFEQKTESMAIEEKWWFRTLHAGMLPWSAACGEREVTADALYDDYLAYADRLRDRGKRAIETKIGIFLKRVVPGIKHERTMVAGSRTYVYQLPMLVECRKAFAEVMQQRLDWGDDGPDWEIDGPPM